MLLRRKMDRGRDLLIDLCVIDHLNTWIWPRFAGCISRRSKLIGWLSFWSLVLQPMSRSRASLSWAPDGSLSWQPPSKHRNCESSNAWASKWHCLRAKSALYWVNNGVTVHTRMMRMRLCGVISRLWVEITP